MAHRALLSPCFKGILWRIEPSFLPVFDDIMRHREPSLLPVSLGNPVITRRVVSLLMLRFNVTTRRVLCPFFGRNGERHEAKSAPFLPGNGENVALLSPS